MKQYIVEFQSKAGRKWTRELEALSYDHAWRLARYYCWNIQKEEQDITISFVVYNKQTGLMI